MELDMIGRLFAQDAALYTDIILATEQRRELIQRFAKAVAQIAKIVQLQDRDQLIREFEDISCFFGTEKTRALEESAILVDALCDHLSRLETSGLNDER